MRTGLLRISSALTIVTVGAVSMAVLAAQAPSGARTPPPTTTSTDAAVKAAADAVKAEGALKA